MNCLTVFVFVGRGDEYGNALFEILLRDGSKRLTLRIEVPARVYRPDNFALLVIEYLDLYDLVLVVRAVFVGLSLCFILALTE